MSVLSDSEKERLRELEEYRAEIRRELEPRKAESGRGGFFQNQAVLLVLAFLLTTGAGSWLTYFWKQREWRNEAQQLELKADLERRAALIDELIRTVATTHTAIHDALALYYYETWPADEVEMRRQAYWKEGRIWRSESKVLRQKLAIYFHSAALHESFDDMITKRVQIGNIMNRLLSGSIKSASEIEEEKKRGLALAGELETLMMTCSDLMAAEMAANQSPAPDGMRHALPGARASPRAGGDQ
jgi:hypothetical protein